MKSTKLFSRRDKAELRKLREETTPTILPITSKPAMYTHSEVLKIAEYVKKSAAEIAIMANHNEDAHNTILRIDVNQFIPKKG